MNFDETLDITAEVNHQLQQQKRNACEAKHSSRFAALRRSCTQCANARHGKTFEMKNKEGTRSRGAGGRKGKTMVHARWTARRLHACRLPLDCVPTCNENMYRSITVTIIATADTEPRESHEQQKKTPRTSETKGVCHFRTEFITGANRQGFATRTHESRPREKHHFVCHKSHSTAQGRV